MLYHIPFYVKGKATNANLSSHVRKESLFMCQWFGSTVFCRKLHPPMAHNSKNKKQIQDDLQHTNKYCWFPSWKKKEKNSFFRKKNFFFSKILASRSEIDYITKEKDFFFFFSKIIAPHIEFYYITTTTTKCMDQQTWSAGMHLR